MDVSFILDDLNDAEKDKEKKEELKAGEIDPSTKARQNLFKSREHY